MNLSGTPIVTSIVNLTHFVIDTAQTSHGATGQAQNSPLGCPMTGAYPNLTMVCAYTNATVIAIGWDFSNVSTISAHATSGYCLFEDDYFKFDNDFGAQLPQASYLVTITSPGCEATSGGPLGNGGFQFLYNIVEGAAYRSGAQFVSTYDSINNGTVSGTVSGSTFTETASTGAGIIPLLIKQSRLGRLVMVSAILEVFRYRKIPARSLSVALAALIPLMSAHLTERRPLGRTQDLISTPTSSRSQAALAIRQAWAQ